MVMAMPGKAVIHQALLMYCRPSASIKPQVTVGGLTPKPREAERGFGQNGDADLDGPRGTMAEETTLGRMCRSITLGRLWPEGIGGDDVFHFADFKHLAADDAGVGDPAGEA